MTVSKLPRTRKGALSQLSPLSWPNDTAVGPRRSRLGLLKQATHNHQQHRISNLSVSSKHNSQQSTEPRPSHAPRISGYLRYKARKRAHRPTQQSKTPKVSAKPPKQNENLADQKFIPRATQPASQASSNWRTDKSEDAKPHKDDHTGKSSLLSPAPPKPPQTDTRPAATAPPPPPLAKDINWPAYDRAKSYRLTQIRIWVHGLRRSHRIVDAVARELMAYYGSEKYGGHPSARILSRHAWQAVRLCEHEFGTDLQWGKGLGEAVWGSEHGKVERLIEGMMEGEGEGEGGGGRGTVGESDLSEFEEDGDEEKEGFWDDGGAGLGQGQAEDVEMAEAA